MKNILESKLAAWVGLLAILVITVAAFPLFRSYWWSFSVLFFAFMGVFSQLASLYIWKLSPIAGKKLRSCAFVMSILAIVAFVAVFIAFQVITE
ncbi:MAG: hypothetical protein HDR88_06485 [Bacteroides sp.]|nr:hypothetical protein [Bacteroides sp.]